MQAALSSRAAIAGSSRVSTAQPKQRSAAPRLVVRAEEGAAAPPAEEKKPWSPPALVSDTPSPIFGGSTGAWLPRALSAPPGAARGPL